MMNKLKAYTVIVELPITTDTILVLASSLGQLDMNIRIYYGEDKEYEVQSVTLNDEYNVILGKPK